MAQIFRFWWPQPSRSSKIALFFENKDRFHEPDFDKLYEIKTQNNFSDSLNRLLYQFSINKIVFGIDYPQKKNILKNQKAS